MANQVKHVDPDTYSVYSYDDNRQLPGVPTRELVAASLSDENDTGFALAEYDTDQSEWSLVTDEQAERIRRRGGQIRHVFVRADES